MSSNVFSYIRVSGRGQIDGDGPERQRESIATFCCTHNLAMAREYFEAGVTGTIDGMDRPEFSAMIQFILAQKEAGVSVAIVVERLDRLARDLMVSEVLLAECRKNSIPVYSADQGQLIDMASDGGDPTRVLIRQIMGALAQWEKTQLVKKLATARARIRAKTGKCEGRPIYQLTAGEKQILNFLATLPPGLSLERQSQFLRDGNIFTTDNKQFTRLALYTLIRRARKVGYKCRELTHNTCASVVAAESQK
jgi:DNA invertase Pin-like site-specific DNA recombinase